MVRTPLYLKLMLSYVVVVALAILPTFLYVRMVQTDAVRTVLRDELKREVQNLADGLSRLPPEEVDVAVRLALATSPRRLTVVDPNGNVVGDSAVTGRVLDNHLQRPEIQQALRDPSALGTAERISATTGDELIYAAARFPRSGPPRGFVRLAGSPAALEQTSAAGADFLWRAGAVAATAAILLSLVAAFVVSRPLRRIAQGARALAHGDFGYDITVHSHDELGEVSDALEELAAKLHQRLHAAGADRAALRALVDDLPVGVILYAADRSPEVVSGAARLLCGLTPDTEAERCRAIPGLASQAALVEKALHDSQVQEAALALPWLPKAVLRARWIALPRQDGSRQLALAILTSEEKDQADRARAALDEAGQALREGARTLGDASLARRLAAAASACELAADLRPVRPQDVKPAALKDLCEAAMADVAALAADRGVTVELQLAAPQLKVVEAGGRVERALRTLLEHVVQTCARGERVGLRADAADGFVRLCTRGRGGEAAFTAEADLLLRALGGEAGRDGSGERAEAWLKIPRA